MEKTSRRDVLTAAARLVVAAPAAATGLEAVAAAVAGRFFTPSELAMVDELTEIIVPTDAHSPGAKAAGVAAYIDARLAESTAAGGRAAWRAGLKALDALSISRHGSSFMKTTRELRLALVSAMAEGEQKPSTDAHRFFVRVKGATISAYYTSKIGLEQEMEYRGNRLLTDFEGTDVS
jgi:hypothetical protein